MPTVSGPLIVVTEQPADVVEVWVRSPEPRPHAGGLMVDSVDRVEVTEGQVSFSCAPGPAILTIVSLVSTGRVSPGQVPETRAVPIMVPDAAAATLADVVTAARVSTLGRSVVEELAARVATDVAAAQEAARAAASDAQLVQDAATSATWTGDVLTVLGESSPPLTGPRGGKGDKGDKGDQGPPGEVTAQQMNAALAGKADLVGGQVPTSQIPAVALTKPHQVNSLSEMLALPAEEGDVAVITSGDWKGSYMLGAGASNVAASWIRLSGPDAPVQSVNGQSGTVVLGASDVGAAPATHSHSQYALSTHTHSQYATTTTVNALSARVDNRRGVIHSGPGPVPSGTIPGAVVGDYWLNETTMELHKITAL